MKKIAIFASGSGSNYEAIMQAIEKGIIKDAEVALLVCNKKKAYVLERARKYNTESFVFNKNSFESKKDYETLIVEELKKRDIDLIVLAGYMLIVGDTLLEAYPNKIINIHPALLPSFKGAHGIKDAFDYGVKVFGVTVHYVSPELDGGKIISQRAFEYYGDSISEVEEKIHAIEHVLYPETINKVLKEQ